MSAIERRGERWVTGNTLPLRGCNSERIGYRNRMQETNINDVKSRFLCLVNKKGIEAAEREFFSGLDPHHPDTAALRRLLLGYLVQDESGQYAYRKNR